MFSGRDFSGARFMQQKKLSVLCQDFKLPCKRFNKLDGTCFILAESKSDNTPRNYVRSMSFDCRRVIRPNHWWPLLALLLSMLRRISAEPSIYPCRFRILRFVVMVPFRIHDRTLHSRSPHYTDYIRHFFCRPQAVAKPQVENILNGFNGCCFAYGQTGSGECR